MFKEQVPFGVWEVLVSKNTICKELDIPRSNFNRYCRNEFQRLDAQLICKLCSYLDCGIEELIEYVKE
ncbi:MAG: helix-turn-helix domain-containing protein [Coprococcus phoceensis]|uniref:helix-turn-helix domain-containing protein n=1 Tax=Coprococcus phoceensis TaxID=1870993 RepID=UPI0009F26208|nr:helix-turn-helix transcriptional regulator [Coprococcus phoceensis]